MRYEKASAELIVFGYEDVITTSPMGEGGDWTPPYPGGGGPHPGGGGPDGGGGYRPTRPGMPGRH